MLNTTLTFNNRFIDHLPADFETDVFQRQVLHAAYSFVNPTKVSGAQLIGVSTLVADLIGFDQADLDDNAFADVFAGNALLKGMKPYAMCYGGHQFGHWAGQLGDGRAINLGEVLTSNNIHFTLQLKGAGATPYSRRADGLAVLRSSVREFLCSEAMFHLGVPTTRALSLCLTGEQVMRDMFYNGNSQAEPGAVVCRVSRSFMRFGSFQLPAMRNDLPLLTKMVNHCINADFPHLITENNVINKQTYLHWFNEICDKTCTLIIHWMRVGFVHGVMNTDNMSILGETIDYGPYGWIDNFDLNWTPNTTDASERRYRFGTQAEISLWNLCQLANALNLLINDAKPLQQRLDSYRAKYNQQWRAMMASKLGLTATYSEDDDKLFHALEALLSTIETDMTLFYRQLATVNVLNSSPDNTYLAAHFASCFYKVEQITPEYLQLLNNWFIRYIARVNQETLTLEQRQATMNAVNPKYVLRNYLAQQAIEKAQQGDYSELHTLQKILTHPYDEQPEYEQYAQKRPEWAREKAGCSMLSCSS